MPITNQPDHDDWGQPSRKLSKEEIDSLSKQRQGLMSILRLSQITILVVFLAAFVGLVRGNVLEKDFAALCALHSELTGATLSNLPTNSLDAATVSALQEELSQYANLTGALSLDSISLAAALWYALSALAGAVALILPMAIFNTIARKQAQSAAQTMYDLIRAEFLKYGVMVICLGVIFKFTTLVSSVAISSLVILVLSEQVLKILSLARQ